MNSHGPRRAARIAARFLYAAGAVRGREAAGAEDEVPIGAIVVYRDPLGNDARVIGAAHNQREQLRDPTAHAEMNWQLPGRPGTRQLAAGRLYAVRDAGTMPDVCGSDRACADSTGCIRRGGIRRPARRRRCSDCSTIRDSITGPRLLAAYWPSRAGRSCRSSSRESGAVRQNEGESAFQSRRYPRIGVVLSAAQRVLPR